MQRPSFGDPLDFGVVRGVNAVGPTPGGQPHLRVAVERKENLNRSKSTSKKIAIERKRGKEMPDIYLTSLSRTKTIDLLYKLVAIP